MEKEDTNDFWRSEFQRFGEVMKETKRKHKENFEKICCILDNWVALLKVVQKYPHDEIVNSVSALFLLNVGKQLRWIIHEILCGAYFEAIRDLRYAFEFIVGTYHIDKCLDEKAKKVFGVNKGAGMGLKYEILEQKNQIGEILRHDPSRGKSIINEKIEELIKGLSKKEKDVHRRFYSGVLNKIVFCKFSGKNGIIKELPFENYIPELNSLYSELSKYTHFSHKILEPTYAEADWDLVFNFSFNERLLDECIKFLIGVMDVFYAIQYLKFEKIRDEIEGNLEYCRLHGISFPITENIIEKEHRGIK